MPKLSTKEQKELMVRARKALHHLWIKALLRGRCWGVKQEDKNPFQGTNITIGTENEIVTVSQDGILKIHEFERTEGTSLGNKVRAALREKKLESDKETFLDSDGLPMREGVYLVVLDDEPEEIDVYEYKMKGLCCFQDDFGSAGTGVDDEHDCHVSVQFTGIKFIKWLRRFDKKEIR